LEDGAIHLCGFVDNHLGILIIELQIGRSIRVLRNTLPRASVRLRLRHNRSKRRSPEGTRCYVSLHKGGVLFWSWTLFSDLTYDLGSRYSQDVCRVGYL
jgi:hypothetical protein